MNSSKQLCTQADYPLGVSGVKTPGRTHWEFQIALTNRKGSRKSALMNLKVKPIVNPRIRNGSSISQSNGKRNSRSKASGQHMTSSIHQRVSATRVLIFRLVNAYKRLASLLRQWPLVLYKNQGIQNIRICTLDCTPVNRLPACPPKRLA